MVEQLLQGYITLFQPGIFPFMIIGFAIGLFFGLVPGLTATLAIALLLPLCFVLPTVPAFVMAMGIFMAGMYSGSITGTTINIPGAPGSAITTIDGYPMMQKGEGAKALSHAAFSSLLGGTAGVVILMFLCPLIAKFALLLQTADRFSLILLALIAVAVTGGGSLSKGIIATIFGLMVATIGIDVHFSISRFSYGSAALSQGLGLIPVIIGVFAISELLIQIEAYRKGNGKVDVSKIKFRRKDFIPKLQDIKKIGAKLYLKSTLIGGAVGALPGGGAAMAGALSYTEAKRSSKHPEEFGKGSLEGVSASETANNAMCSGAMIPMLTLGIPGDAVTAMILGMFLIQGLIPGPAFLEKHFDLVAPMYAALMISAILIPIALLALGPYYIRIVRIRKSILYSFVAVIAMVGCYAAEFSTFQMGAALALGVATYFLRKQGYPSVPILMGVILGPMAESYLRRALLISAGSPMIFFTRPGSVIFLVLSVVLIYLFVFRGRRKTT